MTWRVGVNRFSRARERNGVHWIVTKLGLPSPLLCNHIPLFQRRDFGKMLSLPATASFFQTSAAQVRLGSARNTKSYPTGRYARIHGLYIYLVSAVESVHPSEARLLSSNVRDLHRGLVASG